MQNIYIKISDEFIKAKDGHKMYQYRCRICNNIFWQNEHNAKTVYTCRHKSKTISDKRLKSIYKGMYDRCYNNKNVSFKDYGAKGIKICQQWLVGANFEKWSLANGYRDNLTIDRINPKKDYCPKNCRWVTLEENSRYKSTTNYITVNNITHSGKEWSRILNKGQNFINRYKRKNGMKSTQEYIKRTLESGQTGKVASL